MRQVLLDAAKKFNITALLGPQIKTLQQWVATDTSLTDSQPINDYCRELILYDALSQHPDLYGKGNPWTLTNELLKLFDELTLGNTLLPEDINQFIHQLSHAYGIADGTDDDTESESMNEIRTASALGSEANLVHTLWRAWHQQLKSKNLIDKTTDYVLRLANSTTKRTTTRLINSANTIYLIGFYDFSKIESNWINSNQLECQRHLILHGNDNPLVKNLLTLPPPLDQKKAPSIPYIEGINAIFTDTKNSKNRQTLKNRAAVFSRQYPQSPLKERLSVFTANNSEDEAIAIDLQVRCWLLEGKKNIGIVTENRLLARRVRALLERANIVIDDYSGWALSTSSAASVLERWLQVIEDDFAHEPLLDILKSPYIFPDWDNDERLRAVFRLENDIILHENIPRGLQRYRQHAHYRKKRLPEHFHDAYQSIFLLLDQLQQAAAPLQALFSKSNSKDIFPGNLLSQNTHTTSHLLSSLSKSLDLLGIFNSFEGDSAGERILEELEKMQLAAKTHDIQLDWLGFRTWLGRALEHNNFQPTNNNSPVLLMGVAQSNLHFFDGLILGAVEQAFLPGSANHSPFFNDGVRMELGLAPSTKNQSLLQYHFRRLLESAPNILLTHRQQHENNDVIASPWIDLIQAFHLLAYNEKLTSPMLEKLIHNTNAHVMLCDSKELPKPVEQPRVVIQAQLLPSSVSASTHQQLIDCPYQYFAKQCLQLAPSEEIREALEKSDYGHRVHLCLHAFHGNISTLPGPFSKNIDTSTRLDAILLLEKIADAVFANDLEDNFQHRGWLKKWQGIIPAYIDWQIEHAQNWCVEHVELKQTYENYSHGISLKGRLDRIDHCQQAIGIIDYKTGMPPHQDDVDSGEAIQLPFYALLADKLTENSPQKTIERVEYVYLDNNKSISKTTLQSDHLLKIKEKLGERLSLLMNNLSKGTPAPAWGDELTCSRCTMEGLCRKTVWEYKELGNQNV